MVKVRFDYKRICYTAKSRIKISDPTLGRLVQASILGSLETLANPEFLKPFESAPDTIETQVDIYAGLLDDVVSRLDSAMTEAGMKLSEEEKGEQLNAMRASYALIATVASTIGSFPLVLSYLHEKYGEALNSENAKAGLRAVFDKLKVTDYARKIGYLQLIEAQVGANLSGMPGPK